MSESDRQAIAPVRNPEAFRFKTIRVPDIQSSGQEQNIKLHSQESEDEVADNEEEQPV